MTTLVVEIYEALKKAGVEEELAEKLATKADLRAKLAELKAELKVDIASVRTEIERMGRVVIMWNVGTVIAMASVVFAIMRYTVGSGP